MSHEPRQSREFAFLLFALSLFALLLFALSLFALSLFALLLFRSCCVLKRAKGAIRSCLSVYKRATGAPSSYEIVWDWSEPRSSTCPCLPSLVVYTLPYANKIRQYSGWGGGVGGRVSLIEPWYNTAQPLTLDGIIVFLNDYWKKEI